MCIRDSPSIQYTLEHPKNSTLPYLDTLISWHNSLYLNFSIYRKPTATSSYIHWFSTHSNTIKIATLTSLYLRAFRLCSPQHLTNETNFIRNTFQKLQYPTHIINKSYHKAKNKYYNHNTTTIDNTVKNLIYLYLPPTFTT